jgi:nucleotide-binding universal stress UspA family protein
MRILVGVSPDDAGSDAVALGAVLARLLDASLVLAYVHPPISEVPGMDHVDAEWAAYLQDRADATLQRATAQLATDWRIVDVGTTTVASPSVSRGLRRAARATEASVTVLGPCRGALTGRIGIGSIASSLLHGGETAVSLAPEGFRQDAPEQVGRLVIGFRDTQESRAVVATAQAIAARREIPVQLLTAVLRTTWIAGSTLRGDPERAVLDSLEQRERAAQSQVIAATDPAIVGDVIQADSAEEACGAFSWRPDDLFVTASSRYGPLRRVLLGDTAHKLLRACPVPAIVMPREVEDLELEGADPEDLDLEGADPD